MYINNILDMYLHVHVDVEMQSSEFITLRTYYFIDILDQARLLYQYLYIKRRQV